MKTRKILVFVLCLWSINFFTCASASGGERWTSQIPEPIAILFDEPEWEGYECIDGYAHCPVKEAGEYISSNTAYLIMQKGESYIFCILDQVVDYDKWMERWDRGLPNPEEGQVDPWKWMAKAEKLLPYYGDVIPFIAPLDDMS